MELTLFTDIGIIFGLSIIILLLFNKMKLPSVLGFLVTGMLAGPHWLGIISSISEVEALAEIGIILLLFTIGVEMSIRELWDIKRSVLLGGTVQILTTIMLVYYIDRYFGLSFNTSLFIGFLISLSSTAIVLKLLQEKAELDTPHGRTSLGILIFQDVIIVPMILITPILAGESTASSDTLPLFLLKAIGIIVLVLVSARWIIPSLLFQIAKTRNRELFLLSIVFICLATAWLTSSIGLSLALGAFMAGLIISESEYSHQAMGNIMPFRDIFMSFFFVSIGMLLNIEFFTDNVLYLLGLALAVIIIKSVTAGLATFILGYPLRTIIITGLALAQVGEFSFVLSTFGLEYSLLDQDMYQKFLAVSIITMAVTPFITSSSYGISDRVIKTVPYQKLINGFYANGLTKEKEDQIKDHLIIIGYGFNGKTLSHAARNAGIPYVIIETNPETVRHEKKKGERIHYGDASHEAVLRSANIDSARILVVGISDLVATRKIINTAKDQNPEIYIIARTRYITEMKRLHELGADEVIPEEYETSVEIFVRLLKKYLVPEEDIDKFTREIRANGYCMLRKSYSMDQERVFDLKDELPGMEVSTFKVGENCLARGRTLRELNIRTKHKATILAIRRGNETITNPDGDTSIYPGDVCIIFGKPEDLHLIREVFKGPSCTI
ncbi:monovalent cation:proton antiporter family protein [Methanolobus profundi]|uniref:Kef-type potassium/proton antiporter, CPA2 family n=1 Tax=Methanolobus profundi TaxID=487685 RepID=A0A1I4NGZ5_9EURY|nr:monovalent cation:proton antiporter family protein [Methanolobus profundi]SFM14804.1 Kef-type potassium/proton antiporter, CPA2 family [Methanolobus profundi]